MRINPLELWRRSRRRLAGEAVPLADLPSFEAAAGRARRIRLLLAAALIAAGLAAFASAPTAPGRRFLPSKTVGIVVLDLSSSIQPQTYYRIEHELATLSATRQRFGLVLVSDVAYEAFPPGTPAAELKPLLRFFAPPGSTSFEASNTNAGIARNPWEQWFSGGTNLSNGLFLAADMLRRNHVKHGAVLLISDLNDDPGDLARLSDAVLMYQQAKIPLEIVGLNPTAQNAEFFKTLLGTEAVIQHAALPTSNEARGKLALVASFPRDLALAAVIGVVLLTLNEWWAEPLRWRRRRLA